MNEIHELSWRKVDLFSKFRLLRQGMERIMRDERASVSRETLAAAYSGLSSSCYGILGTARAQLQLLRKKPLTLEAVAVAPAWLSFGVLNGVLMIWSSRRAVALVGLEGMTPDQLDIRQSILRVLRRNAEAEACILEALKRPSIKLHTRALLTLGRAWVAFRQHRHQEANQWMHEAAAMAAEVSSEEGLQAARVFRGAANLNDVLDAEKAEQGHAWRTAAECLIALHGADDQRLKAQAKT